MWTLAEKAFVTLFRTPSDFNLRLFFSDLASSARAGRNPYDALHEIDTTDLVLEQAAKEMRQDIREGYPLSEAMQKYSFFKPYVIASVAAAERAGTFDASFKRIAQFIEQMRLVNKKLSAQLLSFAGMVLMLTFTLYVIINSLVPKIESMYVSRKATLTGTSKMVFGVLHFINDYWFVLVIGFVAFLAVARYMKDNQPEIYDEILLKTPIFNVVYINLLHYRFTASLSLFINSGLSVIEALEWSAKVVGNTVFGTIFSHASQFIREEGMGVAEALKLANTRGVLKPIVISRILNGERGGDLVPELDLCSERFVESIDSSTEKAAKTLNFLILGVVSCVIFFLAVAMMAPQMDLFNTIGRKRI